MIFFGNSGSVALVENSACHNQVIEKNITKSIRKEVGSAVADVDIRVLDAILMAMDIVVLPRVEMAVISVTRS